jgi:hypothetical protein
MSSDERINAMLIHFAHVALSSKINYSHGLCVKTLNDTFPLNTFLADSGATCRIVVEV